MAKTELQTCEAIGTLIRKLRKEQGVTQAQLAGLANTGIRFIGDLENSPSTLGSRSRNVHLQSL